MSGLKLVVPTTFTDAALPMLRDDPLLTVGSLILLDLAHAARPMVAGIPATGGVVPNLAWVEAAATIGGSPTQAALDHALTYSTAANDGVKGKLERTPKGGLHGIVAQATALVANDGAWITLPTALRAYLFANKTHRYYLSVWDRITRINAGSLATTGAVQEGIIPTSTVSYLAQVGLNGSVGMGGGSTTSRLDPSINALGNRYISLGSTVDNTMANTNTHQGGPLWGAPVGSYNANAGAFTPRNNSWPSFVFYRFYLEDLTVSGRTYAAVDALDHTEWVKQVGTTGGRYFGDTLPTAVTAVP